MHATTRNALRIAGAVAAAHCVACSIATSPPAPTGLVAVSLEVAPGVSVETVEWTIQPPALLAADQTGSVNVSGSQSLAFIVGGLPAGSGYRLLLTAKTTGANPLQCAGSAMFGVSGGATTPVPVVVQCGVSIPVDGGAVGSVVIVSSTTDAPSCAAVTALSASPSEVNVGSPLSLSASGVDDRGSAAGASFSWAITGGSGGGSFSDVASSSPTFTCGAAGTVTVSVTIATAFASCTTNRASVQLTCDGTKASAISLGPNHSCAMISNGTVECWGSNVAGQLGNGTDVTTGTPVPVSNLTDAIAVSAGDQHTCALLAGGAVTCWGSQDELGDGTSTGPDDCGFACSMSPVPVPGLTGVTAIASGTSHTCALLADTTVACWGNNSSGQLGDGTQTSQLAPVPVQGLTGVTALAAGDAHTCALLVDGTVQCWGYNFSGQLGDGTSTGPSRCSIFPCAMTPVPVLHLTGARAVVAGGNHTCAILADGTAACWGLNDAGELGNGTTTNSAVPVVVSALAGATAMAAGFYHSCAILAGGAVECWGDNSDGELCDGTLHTSHVPVPVPAWTAAAAVSAGNRDSCALLSTGSVECCGFDAVGQLGDGTVNLASTPVVVGL